MKKGLSKSDLLISDFCGECSNLKRKGERLECRAFNEFWFLWKEGPCPARPAYRPTTKEVLEVLAEESRRGKKGKGEKSDRTHKLFGPARMKDNRAYWPWDEL